MAKSLNDKLPAYLPPESVWEGIEQTLNDLPLQEAVQKLPAYTPPPQTWQKIEQQLPAPTRQWHWYSVAAAIIILLGIGTYQILNSNSIQTKISYSEEIINPKLQPVVDQSLDKQYAQLQAICKKEVTLCEKPDFKSLKQELEQLTLASHQLKDALGNYNTDANLSAQLSEIEAQRADILKKLNERI